MMSRQLAGSNGAHNLQDKNSLVDVITGWFVVSGVVPGLVTDVVEASVVVGVPVLSVVVGKDVEEAERTSEIRPHCKNGPLM